MGRVLVDDHQHSVVLPQPVGVEQLPDQLVTKPGLGVQKFGVEQVQLLRGVGGGTGGFHALGYCLWYAFLLRIGAVGDGGGIYRFDLTAFCGDACGPVRGIAASSSQHRLCQVRRKLAVRRLVFQLLCAAEQLPLQVGGVGSGTDGFVRRRCASLPTFACLTQLALGLVWDQTVINRTILHSLWRRMRIKTGIA